MHRSNKRSWNDMNHHNHHNHHNHNYNNNHNRHHHHNYNDGDNNDYSPSLKRQRLNMSDNSSMSLLAAPSSDQVMIANHYGNRNDGHLEKREQSSIIQLRKINNWIKSVLINMFCHQKSNVLDIGGGKGGDLNKWNYQRIDELVHVDHAIGSIMDAQKRYNEGLLKNRFSFKLTLVCVDAFAKQIHDALPKDLYFDIVSSQFALHYAFETEERVKAMLLNVTQRLREDGYFIGTIPDANVLVQKWRNKSPGTHEYGNSKYHVKVKCDTDNMRNRKKLWDNFKDKPYSIKYMFNLNDAVDCPEYLLHFDNFVKIAKQKPYHLELVLDCNFHEFFARNYNDNQYRKLLQKIGITDFHGKGSIYNDQWEIAYLYKIFVFKKKNLNNTTYPIRESKVAIQIEDKDIIVCQ